MSDRLVGAVAALMIAFSALLVVLAVVSAWFHVIPGVAYSLMAAAAALIFGLKMWSSE